MIEYIKTNEVEDEELKTNEVEDEELETNDDITEDEEFMYANDFEDTTPDFFDSDDNIQDDTDKTEEFEDDTEIEDTPQKTSEFSDFQKISSSSMNELIMRRDKLQNELSKLEDEFQEVKKEGDTSESSVYSALLDKISIKKKEMNNIINSIGNSVVVERKHSETIDVGDKIRIYSPTINYDEMQNAPGKLLEIVDAGLGNPMDGKIHVNAPFIREIMKLSKKIQLPFKVKWKTTSNTDTMIYITEIVQYR